MLPIHITREFLKLLAGIRLRSKTTKARSLSSPLRAARAWKPKHWHTLRLGPTSRLRALARRTLSICLLLGGPLDLYCSDKLRFPVPAAVQFRTLSVIGAPKSLADQRTHQRLPAIGPVRMLLLPGASAGVVHPTSRRLANACVHVRPGRRPGLGEAQARLPFAPCLQSGPEIRDESRRLGSLLTRAGFAQKIVELLV